MLPPVVRCIFEHIFSVRWEILEILVLVTGIAEHFEPDFRSLHMYLAADPMFRFKVFADG